jgi:hypothetical protein
MSQNKKQLKNFDNQIEICKDLKLKKAIVISGGVMRGLERDR